MVNRSRRILIVVALLVGLAGLLTGSSTLAVKVDYDDEPGSGHGGSSSGGSTTPTQCTVAETNSCIQEQGGAPAFEQGDCVCYALRWVPRQVTNALDGDVGIVPIAGNSGGEDAVKVLMGVLGQNHRHAVIFLNDGTQARHNTMYEDQIRRQNVLIGPLRLHPDDLRNGAPGALTQTIDDAHRTGRIADTGLVLKPRMEVWHSGLGAPGGDVNYRQMFETAALHAMLTEGYYKVSDYTDQIGMTLPFSFTRVGDLRGSHCSGYVSWAFQQVGYTVPTVSYDEDIRLAVGEALHQTLYDAVMNEIEPPPQDSSHEYFVELGQRIKAGLAEHLKPDAAENVANQMANCFAGLGCDNLSRDWEHWPGTGDANSPDNLLPTTFAVRSGDYTWNGVDVEENTVVDNSRWGISGPFGRVEAQVVGGGYYTQTRLQSW